MFGNNLAMRQFQMTIENAMSELGLMPGEAYYILMYEAASIEKLFDQMVQKEYQDQIQQQEEVQNSEEEAGQE